MVHWSLNEQLIPPGATKREASVATRGAAADFEATEGKLFGFGSQSASLNCSANPDACHVITCVISELQRGTHDKATVKIEVRKFGKANKNVT